MLRPRFALLYQNDREASYQEREAKGQSRCDVEARQVLVLYLARDVGQIARQRMVNDRDTIACGACKVLKQRGCQQIDCQRWHMIWLVVEVTDQCQAFPG